MVLLKVASTALPREVILHKAGNTEVPLAAILLKVILLRAVAILLKAAILRKVVLLAAILLTVVLLVAILLKVALILLLMVLLVDILRKVVPLADILLKVVLLVVILLKVAVILLMVALLLRTQVAIPHRLVLILPHMVLPRVILLPAVVRHILHSHRMLLRLPTTSTECLSLLLAGSLLAPTTPLRVTTTRLIAVTTSSVPRLVSMLPLLQR